MSKNEKIIIGLIILLFVVFALYVVANKVNFKFIPASSDISEENTKISDSDKENQRTKEENSSKDKEKDKEFYNEAISSIDIEKCLLVKDAKLKDQCAMEVSIKSVNLELCDSVVDKDIKNDCVGTLSLMNAKRDKDISVCNKIKDELKRGKCFNSLIEGGLGIEECEKIPLQYTEIEKADIEYDELRDICKSRALYSEFLNNQEKEVCEAIPVCETRAMCRAILEDTTLDSDKDADGLSFIQEVCFGSNPDIYDTDGDGVGDSEEIENSHDPARDKKIFEYIN